MAAFYQRSDIRVVPAPGIEKDSLTSDPGWPGVTGRNWFEPNTSTLFFPWPLYCSLVGFPRKTYAGCFKKGKQLYQNIHCWYRTQELPSPMPVRTAEYKKKSRGHGEENISGGGEARFCLYLRMWSDYLFQSCARADRSLVGWSPVDRFSPQIFDNKPRCSDCVKGRSPWGIWDPIIIYMGIYRPFYFSVLR